MKNWKYLILLCTLVVTSGSFAQIEVPDSDSDPDPEPKNVVITPKAMPDSPKTEVFAFANWSQTNRTLQPNPAQDGIFADSLGIRADEKALNVWSYGIGIRSQLYKNISWQGGISWLRNGETFDYQATDSDSSFRYQTYYNYISMPLKLMYRYGNRVSVFGGVGIVPQMFFSYRQEQQWTTPENTAFDEQFKTRNGYNSFVLSGAASIGVQVRMNNGIAIYVEPEYRFQFTNSYEETDGFEHFGRAIGVNMGISYPL